MTKKEIAFNIFVSETVDNNGTPKQFYTKIGVAFANQGGGFSLKLNALPIDGKCVAFPPSEKKEEKEE